MTWNKPAEPQKPLITKPRILNWILFFVYIAFLNFLCVYFLADQALLLKNSSKTIMLYVVLPVFTYVILLAFRLFWYFGKHETVDDIWAEEIPKFHARWRNWANAQIAVIDSQFFTPYEIDAHKIRNDDVLMNLNQELRLDHTEKTVYFDALLMRLHDLLEPLQTIRHKNCRKPYPFNIHIVSSYTGEAAEHFQQKVQTQLNRLLPNTKFGPYNVQFLSLIESVELLGQLTDKQYHEDEEILTLVILHHLAQEQGSDCVGSFLLASPALLRKYEKSAPIKCQSYLLRLMMSQDDTIATDELVEMQPVILQSQHLWMTQLQDDKPVTKLLQEMAMSAQDNPQNEAELPEQYKMDLFLGNASSLSFWLALHFASETAFQTNSTGIAIGEIDGQTLFNVVSPVALEAEPV